jgi:tetratricopeptide (TPR) repeat protein
LLRETLAIEEKSLQADHPAIARTLNNLALSHYYAGDDAAARELFERTISIYESNGQTESSAFAMVLNNFGLALLASGDHDAAKQRFSASLELRERELGPIHADIAQSLANLGYACFLAGDDRAAREYYERSLVAYESALGPGHPHVGIALNGLARVDLRAHRFPDAIRSAERAVEIRSGSVTPPDDLADSEIVLARALWDAAPGEGRDRPRAFDLARRARDRLRGAEGASSVLEDVTAWLDEHAEPR